ncbi:Tkp4 protein [Vanderwaltozyma polyspora DSM 70294]|uniref:Tkp4 protein n=1 Tax=Vanderwaltozyma polyspora (strain ATCC 22028 / DSM 70294 / BCRC 21397 / CBS 2163 / NBRC 10782 / NRRL Y-8283 / UCD 57-17) TaxID=436907 RepID=A7TNH4_VANPO|nr:Tkp4 protein [Vanderwaltozyma polyspora DSM 70294]EDO16157.1 Tkp4 protein [Vanderwaltozyma polyspora DSM 70294]
MNHYSNIKSPGASWSLDTFGPVKPSPNNNYRFMLVMIDNVSRYVIISTHLTKDMNTYTNQIENSIHFIKTQFGRTVQELIMDRGSGFNNSQLKELCDEFGIHRVFTAVQDHSANARAERGIRTIISDARTLLIQARIRLKFWHYAAKAAVNVRN